MVPRSIFVPECKVPGHFSYAQEHIGKFTAKAACGSRSDSERKISPNRLHMGGRNGSVGNVKESFVCCRIGKEKFI